jgi:hypothetical protein
MFRWVEEKHVSLQRKSSVLEAGASPRIVSLWALLVFERNASANHSFQGGQRLILYQIGLFSWVKETQVSVQRHPSVLDAGRSRALFPCENWVSFSSNTSFNGGISWWRKLHCALRRPIQIKWKSTFISPRQPRVLQAGGTRSLIPCENCVNFLKEYLLQIAVFQKEKVLILFQIDIFRRVEEIQVSLRTIPSM